jgi:hypothetical protein
MFSRSALLLLLTYSAFSQSSAIQGVVSDDSGNSPTDIYVVATPPLPLRPSHLHHRHRRPRRLHPFQSPRRQLFRLRPVPRRVHLNNCHWGAPINVTLAASQTLSRNLSITQGALFQLRLDDPQHLISPTDDLLVGVFLPNGFSPMRLAVSDPTGRTYDLAVPLKTSIRLNIISRTTKETCGVPQ